MRTMIGLEEAYSFLEALLEDSQENAEPETVALHEAPFRHLAEDLFCAMDHPPFSQSAMDGIAFCWQPENAPLKVVGTFAAGVIPEMTALKKGEAVRIMTGAPLPKGADTVEMVEKVQFEGNFCHLTMMPASGQHVRLQGENLGKGAPVAACGDCLTPARCAALASQGFRWVKVKPRIKLGLATTGDEVVSTHHALEHGQIYNSNGPALEAALSSPDVIVVQLGTLPDSLGATTAFLKRQTELNVLVLTGGVSMGEFDYVPKAAANAGFTPLFHKVKMKPGKPIWLGKHSSGTLMFGLPGNPVSALVGAALFVRPALDALRRGFFQRPHWGMIPLAKPVENQSKFPFFQGAVLTHQNDSTVVMPVETSGSGDVVRFGAARTLIKIPPGCYLEQGNMVEVLLSSVGVIG